MSATDSPAAATRKAWERVDERKVDSFFDRARQGLHCSLACGGVRCKHENWEVVKQWKNRIPAAIEGLNSCWVGENIIASQRPSSSLFVKFPLIEQFKAQRVTGVFNLQEKGEHASCGPDGIYPETGYSYIGEQDLMRFGVSYYEFPWPDMTAPDNDIVLRSVQVMDFHIRNSGKVLVHCHAGLGRTGLMIASYLVFALRMTADEAIKLVRTSRPGAVQTSKQVQFVHAFEKHLFRLFQSFRVEISDATITLFSFMKRQRLFLHGEEALLYKHVPRHLNTTLCRLIAMCAPAVASASSRRGSQHDEEQKNPRSSSYTQLRTAAVQGFSPGFHPPEAVITSMRIAMNHGRYEPDRIEDPSLLAFLTLDWFRCMSEPVLDTATSDDLISYMKQTVDPGAGTGLQDAITSLLNRPTRHTIGMLLSAVYTMCFGDGAQEIAVTELNTSSTNNRSLQTSATSQTMMKSMSSAAGVATGDAVATYNYALKCVIEALTHAHHPAKVRHSPHERQILLEMCSLWAKSVNSMYFGDPSKPRKGKHKVISAIALASEYVLTGQEDKIPLNHNIRVVAGGSGGGSGNGPQQQQQQQQQGMTEDIESGKDDVLVESSSAVSPLSPGVESTGVTTPL